MKSNKKMVDKRDILVIGTFIFSIVILSMYFVFAAHTITTSSGGTSFSVDEDVSNLFNITVNNTDTLQTANITSVNITLPSAASCTFVLATDGSSAGSVNSSAVDDFLNNSNILSWTNATGYVINASESKFFWFNTTCTAPGTYNITVRTTNVTASYESNLSFEVNDTTEPAVTAFNTPPNNANISLAQVINVTISDTVGVSTVFFNVSNGTQVSWLQATNFAGDYWNATLNDLVLAEGGIYNITVSANDSAGNVNKSEYITIKYDITSPTASMGTNPVNDSNSSSADVVFDLKCVDVYSLSKGVLYGNWSSGWQANQTNASILNDSFWNITVSGIVDGIYIWGVYCNDTASNGNWSIVNRTLRVDTTAPTPSASCTPSTAVTGDVVTCTCGGSDSVSGINGALTSATSTPSTALSGTFSYSCSVTDYAGNFAGTTVYYTLQGQDSDSSSSSSSGGGATTSTFTYSKTIPQTGQEFKEIEKIETSSFSGGGLRVKERVKIKFNDEEHFIGVRELTETSAKIEIASDPVQVNLEGGEDVKMDFDEDGYYDIYVKLNEIVSGKANLTIKYLNELIPEEVVVESTAEDVTPPEPEPAPEPEPEPEKNLTKVYVLIGIILLAIILAVIVGVVIVKKRSKTYTK